MAAKKKSPKASELETPAKESAHQDPFQTLTGDVALLPVRLKGDHLLVHQWSEKAVIEMLSRMTGHDMPQMPKDLTREYESSHYRNTKDEHVLPCRTIKACLVSGASATGKSVKPSEIKQKVRIMGHTAPIHGAHEMDVRIVEVGPWNDRVPDVRARCLYTDWHIDVVIRYPHHIIPAAKIVLALRQAGEEVGLCEFRQQKGGDLGGFSIEALPEKSVEAIIKACSLPEQMFKIPPELLRSATTIVSDKDRQNMGRRAVGAVNAVNGAVDRFEAEAEAQ
jgi:hypothetical protein